MIGAICLIALGAFSALYFTHKTFRDRVHDLVSHVKSLFVKEEPKPAAPATETASTNAVATTVVVTPAAPAQAAPTATQ